MLYPDTQIQYIDIKDGEPRYKTINEFYQEYSHKSKIKISDNVGTTSEIDFTDMNVKITDLFGWTQVLMVRKIIQKAGIRWADIVTANKQILISTGTLVPYYQKEETNIGFHGEVKHAYVLKNPSKANDNDCMRIHNGETFDGNPIEFARQEIINTFEGNDNYGYEIITKSRFFNANDIHMFGSDHILTDEAVKWYK